MPKRGITVYKCSQCGKYCWSWKPTKDIREIVFFSRDQDLVICDECSVDWEAKDDGTIELRGQ